MRRILLLPLLLALPLIGMTLLVSIQPLHAAPEGAREVFPIQKPAPVAVTIETGGSEAELRRQMRVKNHVAELSTETIRFSEAPVRSFGFVGSQALGMALVMQSPDLEFEQAASTSNTYEIHKIADGSGLLVGFMDRETASKVALAERPKNLRIMLYSKPVEKAPIIVAVPLTKVMVDRMPIRLDPKKPDGPMMLDMDLLTTVNRKSTVGR